MFRIIVPALVFVMAGNASAKDLNILTGAGMSMPVRALAADFGARSGDHVMVVPQKPYIPIGSLRAAVTYPAVSGAYSDDAIRKALGRKDRPGILKIAKELGVGTSTVQRIAAESAR